MDLKANKLKHDWMVLNAEDKSVNSKESDMISVSFQGFKEQIKKSECGGLDSSVKVIRKQSFKDIIKTEVKASGWKSLRALGWLEFGNRDNFSILPHTEDMYNFRNWIKDVVKNQAQLVFKQPSTFTCLIPDSCLP